MPNYNFEEKGSYFGIDHIIGDQYMCMNYSCCRHIVPFIEYDIINYPTINKDVACTYDTLGDLLKNHTQKIIRVYKMIHDQNKCIMVGNIHEINRAYVIYLEQKNIELEKEIAMLKTKNTFLIEENKDLNDYNEALEHENDELNYKINGFDDNSISSCWESKYKNNIFREDDDDLYYTYEKTLNNNFQKYKIDNLKNKNNALKSENKNMQSEIKSREHQINKLNNEIYDLQQAVYYQPGGEIANECQNHFESLCTKN